MFFDVYKYIYSESLFSALDIGMNHMLKKCPSEKINVTKTELFFYHELRTRQSCTFNSRFLYELKGKVSLSKSVCGIFHFRFCFVFIKIYVFVQQKAQTP